MKRLISVLFTAIFIVLSMVPCLSAVAADEVYENIPIVFIRGNGETLYDADGNVISSNFLDAFGGEGDDELGKEKIVETAVNILLPFLAEGLLMDDWDNYGKALYDELAPLWEQAALDSNGNAKEGTGVSQSVLKKSESISKTDIAEKSGVYDYYGYYFRYDWRLSPYDHVDRLNEYIHNIMDATGYDKVNIAAKCMGGSLVNAYLEKYGSEGHVKKVFYTDVLVNGCSYISDIFSGKIDLDGKTLQNFLMQLNYCEGIGEGLGLNLSEFVIEVVTTTVDIFVQTNTADTILGDVEDLYERLYKAFIPAMVKATGIGTWVNYWAGVYEEDFDEALNLVFGQEGSETRIANAGLVEKIQYYRNHITKNLPELYKTFTDDYGIEIGVFAKYGFLNIPFVESHDEVNDTLVGLESSSFGATVNNVYEPLSDEYIKQRTQLGYGDMISPDGMVDASTCIFPETTWIQKNAHHNQNNTNDALGTYFLNYSNVKVNTNKRGISQFLVYDNNNKKEIINMTAENSAAFDWLDTAEQNPTTETKLASLIRFITMLFKFLTKLFNGEISLG